MKYSKNKRDEKNISLSFLQNNGFQDLDDKNTLLLSINGEIDLLAARRRSIHDGKTAYKVKIRDTDVGLCKKRGDGSERFICQRLQNCSNICFFHILTF